MGYNFISDKVIDEKLPELQEKTQGLLNPKDARADLLQNLVIRLDDIKKTYEDVQSIDLESIEDPEIREIVKEAQENLSEEDLEEIVKLVEDIQELNDKEGVKNKTIGKILDKILPNPTPTPSPESSTPAPSETPPAPQCNWICEQP